MSALNALIKNYPSPYNPLGDNESYQIRKIGLRREKDIRDAFKLGQHDRLNGMDYNNIFDYNDDRRAAYKRGFNSLREY